MRILLSLLLLTICIPANAALTDSLEAYWKLDEASGNMTDEVAGYVLVESGSVDAITGILNSGQRFINSDSDKLAIADNAALSFGDEDMTLSFWYYKANSGSYISVGKWDTGTSLNHEWGVRFNANKLEFYVSNNGTSAGAVASSADLANSAWYHVVCYHDATANEIGLIINDGTPVTTSYSGGIRDGTQPFEIGGSNTYYSSLYTIDEVGVWRRVLTSEEITQLYNSGSGLSYDSFGGGSSPLLIILLMSAVLTLPIIRFFRGR